MKAPTTAPPPTIIDVEASGFGRGSYPIEVGLALPHGNTYCALIQPLPDWTHWSDEAQRMHGITREELFANGHAAREVAGTLNQLLGTCTVYTDAWSFDLAWLGRLYDEVEITQRFRLESLSTLIDEAQKPIWDATRVEVSREFNLRRHRASNDARIVQLTWLRTRAMI